jgi:hypothetical protein
MRVSVAIIFVPIIAHASESWLCSRAINGKELVTDYKVIADMLLINKGKGHYTILQDDQDHVVSFSAFSGDVTRPLSNGGRVVVSEPFVSYIIIEKRAGRLIELSSVVSSVISDSYGAIPTPAVDTQRCRPN